MKTSLIILAAGSGSRFGQAKAFVKLMNKTLLEWSLDLVKDLDFVSETVLVLREKDISKAKNITAPYFNTNIVFIRGGNSRIDSAQLGLLAASGDILLFHNVANPLVQAHDFVQLVRFLKKSDGACFVGQRNTDTLRRIHKKDVETINREDVWRVQTPQGFRRKTLSRFLAQSNLSLTDEVQLYEGSGFPIKAFETNLMNFKITNPDDLKVMEQYLERTCIVGLGEDSHQFGTEGTLILGGIKVNGHHKLKGNSDGDVILHALYNAISSALGEGSLSLVSDTMCLKHGITDSAEYLHVILKRMQERNYRVNNLSISLECMRPKIEPLVYLLKEKFSRLLDISPDRIGITATSGENLTSFGRGEGVRCIISVSLVRHT